MTPPDAIAIATADEPAAAREPTAEALPGHDVDPAILAERPSWSKYLSIFTVSLKERMTYRGDFLARHDPPVPAHGDDHSALAGDLRRLGPVRQPG